MSRVRELGTHPRSVCTSLCDMLMVSLKRVDAALDLRWSLVMVAVEFSALRFRPGFMKLL